MLWLFALAFSVLFVLPAGPAQAHSSEPGGDEAAVSVAAAESQHSTSGWHCQITASCTAAAIPRGGMGFASIRTGGEIRSIVQIRRQALTALALEPPPPRL